MQRKRITAYTGVNKTIRDILRSDMKHPKRPLLSEANQRLRIGAFVAVFAAMGVTAVILTRAATPTASVEVEDGAASGSATVMTDAAASSGGYIKFSGQIIDITATSGTDQAILQRAIDTAPAHATIRVNGTGYAAQTVRNTSTNVTVVGAAGAVLPRLALTNVQNVTFSNLRIYGFTQNGGVEVHENSAHLRFDNVIIDASASSIVCGVNANTVRGMSISSATSADTTTWPDDIWVSNSNISGATVDQIAVYTGGNNLHLINNTIHDFRSGSCDINDEHNDGIQLVNASNVEIRGNTFYSPPGRTGGPDQAIIASTTGTQHIENLVIADNIIHDWPGTGIIVSGSAITNASITGNTISCAWGGVVIGASTDATASGNIVNLTAC